jgi:hypothetical protein
MADLAAFYLDLAQWAVEDPSRWACWVAPCPVGPAETVQGKAQRHRKSRMDARTRERLPVLPVLVRCAARQYADAAALLQAARAARPGEMITAAGEVLARADTASGSRLVASTRTSSQAASSPAHSHATAPIACSQLSSTSSSCCPASTCSAGTPGCSGIPAPLHAAV